jgi:hypothetical protein
MFINYHNGHKAVHAAGIEHLENFDLKAWI